VNVDLEACTAYGVPVVNTPGRNAEAVADLTLALMLMLARKLPGATAFLRDPECEAGDLARLAAAHSQFQGRELWSKTIGLVGMGAIGRGVARRALACGAQVLVYDPYLSPQQAALAGAELVPLEKLLRESDFVSLHAPVTEETRGMLGAREFGLMKRGAFLINTARAALLDEAALLEALRCGHLGGAGLDVFSVEPPGADHALLALPNVIATPHIGGNTAEVAAHQGRIIADELERILAGEQPRFLLNPEAFEGFSWRGPRRAPSPQELSKLRAGGGPAISDLDLQRPPTQELGKAPLTSPPSGQPAERGRAMSTFEEILRRFLERLPDDPVMGAFAAGRRFILHYTLADAGLEFYMAFLDGAVGAGMGPPPEKPDLRLKMRAEVFDGMMTGKINPVSAAMRGKMKFSGDTRKAMQMQRIQKDIMRLYQEARREVGDPGDLSRLAPAAAPEARAAPSPGGPAPPPAAAPLAGRTGDERDELVAIAQELYDKDLLTATGGNLSVRVAGREDQLWITPSGMFKGALRADMMVRIDMEGEPLDEQAPSPSSEKWVHTEILKRRPDLNAVIHTHGPWATLLALTETPFLPVSTEAAFIGEIPRVPFIMPGTRELAQAVAQAMGEEGTVVLMQNHGLVVAGSSLRRAASTTEVVERYAELILRCKALGKEPPVLPEEAVRALREMGRMMA
jgi:autoinducer 2 (AI-2) kinase